MQIVMLFFFFTINKKMHEYDVTFKIFDPDNE